MRGVARGFGGPVWLPYQERLPESGRNFSLSGGGFRQVGVLPLNANSHWGHITMTGLTKHGLVLRPSLLLLPCTHTSLPFHGIHLTSEKVPFSPNNRKLRHCRACPV